MPTEPRIALTRPQPLRAGHVPPGALVDGTTIIDWLEDGLRYGAMPDQLDKEKAESTYWQVEVVETGGKTTGGGKAALMHTLNAGTWCIPANLPVMMHGRIIDPEGD